LLLPGPTDSWRSYEPVLERIRISTRTIAVSQRGHGDSEKPATGYRVEDFAADLVGLLEALHIKRAVLAAHSGSCLVARRVALDMPERVAGLVFEASPTTLVGDAGLTAFVESVVSHLEDPIDPGFARSFVVDTSSGEVASEVLDQLVSELLKVPARVWRDMFGGLLQYNDMPELGRVAAPVLLIWGDRDGFVSREMQEQLAARFSCADLLVYPGVGHTPRWEDPLRFATDVAAFVERLLPD
jgi:non-heme chloroperoxidase